MKHGHYTKGVRSLTYRSWDCMVQRTTNFGHPAFAQYSAYANPEFLGPGGFERFLAAAGERPSKAHTLDRIDGTKGYVIGNLRWSKAPEQARNKLHRKLYGRTVGEWAELLGVKPTTVRKRLERKQDHDTAFPLHLRLTDSI